MAEENNTSSTTAESTSTPAASSMTATTWKLPDGIEDHIESGLMKTAVGIAAGGLVGMIMFRGGKGWRAASVAAGVGAAAGSTYERFVAESSSSTTTA